MKKKRYEVIQDSKQEDSEGSEKRKLDRDLVRGDQTCLNKKKKKNSNTEEQEILSKWTKYCSELNNHGSYGGNAVLYNSEPPGDDL